MPPRAGKVMRAVLEDLVDLANKRIASGWQTMPIAYGSRMAAQRLDVRHQRRDRGAARARAPQG